MWQRSKQEGERLNFNGLDEHTMTTHIERIACLLAFRNRKKEALCKGSVLMPTATYDHSHEQLTDMGFGKHS